MQAIGQWLAPLPVVSPAGTVPHCGTGVPVFVQNELIQLMREVVLTVAQTKVP